MALVAALLALGACGGHSAAAATHDRVEQAGHLGAPTFLDHHAVTGAGPHIPALAKVSVSCRVRDPSIPSVTPDGWWYQIASSPWDGRYWAAANAFFDGDPINGPYSHNTDFAVPVCPG